MKWNEIPGDRKGKVRLVVLLTSIALVAFGFRLLIHFDSAGSALTYVAIPFAVAVILLFFTERSGQTKWYFRYWNTLRDSMIILLFSSIVLFEGFICVLMFIPIYVLIVTVTFIIAGIHENVNNDKSGPPLATVLPVLVLVSSLEGTMDSLSVDPYNEVVVAREINLSVDEIKANLTRKRQFQSPPQGMMSIFPPPILFDGEFLEEDQIHTVVYRYHRWLFTNTHEGTLTVRLATVNDREIETEVINDTSYISTYLKLHGTRMTFAPISDDRTIVTLKISFDRLLHPAWYFQPLERYGVEVMGETILTQLVAGENGA